MEREALQLGETAGVSDQSPNGKIVELEGRSSSDAQCVFPNVLPDVPPDPQ